MAASPQDPQRFSFKKSRDVSRLQVGATFNPLDEEGKKLISQSVIGMAGGKEKLRSPQSIYN
jgi:hypothetical protein